MREVPGSSLDRRTDCSAVSLSTLPPVLLESLVAYLFAVGGTNRQVARISPSFTGHVSRLASNHAFAANMTCQRRNKYIDILK